MARLLVVVPSDTDPPTRLGEWLNDAAWSWTSGTCRHRRRAARGPRRRSTGCWCSAVRSPRWTPRRPAPELVGVRAPAGPGGRRRRPHAGGLPGRPAAGRGRRRQQPGRARTGPEVGATLVAKRDAADADPLFGPLPLSPDVLQWHHDEIDRLPPARRCWPATRTTPHQAYRVGEHVYGLQFHIETDADSSGSGPRPTRSGWPPAAWTSTPSAPGPTPCSPTSPRCGRRSPAGSPTWSGPRGRSRAALTRDAPERRRRPAPGRRPAGAVRLRGRRPGRPAAGRPDAGPVGPGAQRAGRPRGRPGGLRAGPGRRPRPRASARCTGWSRRSTAPTPTAGSAAGAARPAARVGDCCAPGCSRSSAPAPGWPTTSPRTRPTGSCWTPTTARPRRPSPQELEQQMLFAVGADPDDPPWGVRLGKAAPDAAPVRVAALRLAYRRAVLRSPAATSATGCPPTRSPRSSPTSPAAVLTAGLALAVAEQPADAAPCRLAVIALGKTGGRELNYVSDVDVVFVAEPVDPTADDAAALASATRVAGGPDADLRPGGLGGRRRAAAGGQGRRAGPHPGRPPGLLRAVGQHLGVPGAAEDAAGRRRPGAGPGVRRGAVADGVAGRRPARLRRRGAGDAPAGGGEHPGRRRPTASSSSAAAGCATSSSPCSCCSWCTAGPTPRCGVGGTLPALHRAVGRRLRRPGRRRRRWSPPTASCAPSSTGCSCSGCGAPTCCPTTSSSCAGWPARWATSPTTAGDAVDVLQAELALHTREVRRLHEKLFYRPLLSAVARVPGEQLALGPQAAGGLAAGAGLRRPGRRAAAHRPR